ncbi:MAG: tetratricopeptide repeat protein [Rhodocyclaceae bacterium]|nr:tetratricopeptide repeat protein [Rhodocyclaceae bacterium]MDZ4216680.1 tetratricopeptide repeat protein [Rhodocyclaceae bacterium]
MLRLAIQLVLAVLVVFAVVAVYWSGLSGGFFFDDNVNISAIEALKLSSLDFQSLLAAWQSGKSGPLGRPIAQVSFGLNHYFGGFDPYFFKLTNLVIHLLTGILVFLTARRLSLSSLWAGFAAALWLLHPIQLTSVLYVVQRMTSLSALFLLAAFLLHVAGRERGGRAGWVMLLAAWGVCWPLSMLSKETGALLPLFVLAWELILRRSRQGGLDRFARLYSALALVGLSAGLVYVFSPAGQWLWAGYELRAFTPWERVLTEGRVLWVYLDMIAFPRLAAFSLFHDDIVLSSSLLEPWTTWLAAGGLLALCGVIFWAHKKHPLLAFGLAWFLIGHALESTFLPLEIAHEHRNYLPLFGIALIVAWGVGQLTQQPGWKRTLGLVLGVVVIAHSALITGLRAHQYGDDVRRTQIDAQHHPLSSRTHYEAARVLMQRAVDTSANDPLRFFVRSHYEQSALLDPNTKLPWLGLMHLNCSARQPIEQQWHAELARRLRETPFAPGDRTVLYGVKEMSIAGTLCLERDSVELLFSAALANKTASNHVRSFIHSWLADYRMLAARDVSAAVEALDKSLALAPHNPSNRLKRAQLAYLQQQWQQAETMLNGISDKQLALSERETKRLLLQCIGGGDLTCVGL